MRKRKTMLWSFLIPLISISLFISLSYVQNPQYIAKKAFPSVVMLVMEDSQGQTLSLGSGFFVRKDIVATNLHVIEGAIGGYAKIVGKKPKYNIAGFISIDKQRDLILLKLQGVQAISLPLGDSSKIAVGDEVYAVGSPRGLEGTFSRGIISSIRKVGEDSLLQITAPISPGSSGGPVLNIKGEVIGVAVATFSGGQNLNFAIPSRYVQRMFKMVDQVKSLKTLKRQRENTKSIIYALGSGKTDGVLGNKLIWEYAYGQTGGYSFSIRNKLRNSIEDILCLVIFYDRSGEPIEVDLVEYAGIIPAGLAKRVKSYVDGSVQVLTTNLGSKRPFAKIEFRILDFNIID